MLYLHRRYMLLIFSLLTFTGCASFTSLVPLEVDDTSGIYSGAISFDTDWGNEDNEESGGIISVELEHLYASGESEQTLEPGEFTVQGTQFIDGPGTFPVDWKFEKTNLAFTFRGEFEDAPDTDGFVFVTARVGVTRHKHTVSMYNEFTGVRVKKHEVDVTPLLGAGVGYQFGDTVSLTLDSIFSLYVLANDEFVYLFGDRESNQFRFFLTFEHRSGFKLDLGYQALEYKDPWDVDIDVRGPWISFGMGL